MLAVTTARSRCGWRTSGIHINSTGASLLLRPSCGIIESRAWVGARSKRDRDTSLADDVLRRLALPANGDVHAATGVPPANGAERVCSQLCALFLAGFLSVCPPEALANEKVAEFAASGLLPLPGVFRDTVQVVRLTDPGVEGVSLYFTDYSRSLVEKLSSDPFADPSQSSITCVATGPIKIKDPEAAGSADGEEIFSELKTLNLFQNKRLRVRRIYDKTNGAIIYVSYSTRFTSTSDEGGVSSSRYRTSTCALPLQNFP